MALQLKGYLYIFDVCEVEYFYGTCLIIITIQYFTVHTIIRYKNIYILIYTCFNTVPKNEFCREKDQVTLYRGKGRKFLDVQDS